METQVPHAIEIERVVLGAMIMDPESIPEIAAILTVKDFYDSSHRKVFSAICALHKRQEPVDVPMLKGELEREGHLFDVGGPAALLDIADSVLSAASAPSHARIVKEKATRRALMTAAGRIIEKCRNGGGDTGDLVAEFENRIKTIRAEHNSAADREVVVVSMDKVDPKDVEWLWPGWLPRGKIVLLEGDAGCGKSTFFTCLAAIISRGWPFPDSLGVPGESRDPMGMLLLAGEDGLADTVRPRLDRAGADPSRVFVARHIRERKGGAVKNMPLTLQDIELLEETIVRHNIVVVGIDPLAAYVGRDIDTNKITDTRPLLTALAEMLERTNTTSVIVRHFRKSAGSAEDKGGGQKDIWNVARAAIHVGVDPDDPDPRNPSKYLMALAKHNLTKRPQSMLYSLDGGKFQWCGASEYNAHDIVRFEAQRRGSRVGQTMSKLEQAKEMLNAELIGLPVNSKWMIDKLKDAGISDGTISTARKELGLIAKRAGGEWCLGRPADFENTNEDNQGFFD